MKTWKLIVLVAALLVIVILGAVGGRWYAGNRKPNFTGKADLYVRPQMTVDDVLTQIPDSIVVNRHNLSRVVEKSWRTAT